MCLIWVCYVLDNEFCLALTLIFHGKGLYAASKRSLEIVGETLRLELEPFGVKVLEVVTSAVQSKAQTHFEDWKLPKDSIYASIEDIIANRASGNDGSKRQNTDVYAAQVVDDIIHGATGKVWRGEGAGSIKFATAYVPQGMIVGVPLSSNRKCY